MPQQQAALTRPPIYVVAAEADSLTDLALAAQSQHPLVSELLLEELGRATPCLRENIPADVVIMRSTVAYLDERTGKRRTVQLVFPSNADSDAQRISILTPIGAALIGMRAGTAISWPDLAGAERVLRVIEVSQPSAELAR
jgi:regulator of nucleoside diphosphate kinase